MGMTSSAHIGFGFLLDSENDAHEVMLNNLAARREVDPDDSPLYYIAQGNPLLKHAWVGVGMCAEIIVAESTYTAVEWGWEHLGDSLPQPTDEEAEALKAFAEDLGLDEQPKWILAASYW